MIKSLISTLFRRMFGAKARLLAVGSAAPHFEVLDHTGARRKLQDYRGQRLVLWFFPKAATPG